LLGNSKFKLNQNHPVERRQKVVHALKQRGNENALALAAMMQTMLPSEG
jgi:transcriptional regulator